MVPEAGLLAGLAFFGALIVGISGFGSALVTIPLAVQFVPLQFALPPDDERLTVEIGDGAEALTPECCDVLVVDAFEDELHVPKLASSEFYDAAFLAVREPGVVVVNFMNDDPKFDLNLQRLERAFGGAVLAMPALYDPNILAFAFRGAPGSVPWTTLRVRLQAARDESLHAAGARDSWCLRRDCWRASLSSAP